MKLIYLIIIYFLSEISVMAADRQESICYGTTEKGLIENAWQIPSSGKNFSVYSSLGAMTGRNYVHSKVYKVVLDAYKDMLLKASSKVFVYGETGWKKGGRLRPHKTHQNGLSVDFFVPVIDDSKGASVPLPASPLNKFRYNIEFTTKGTYNQYSIDFESMAAHLFALKDAADKNGIKIFRIIFDNDLQKLLFNTSKGKVLQALLPFSTKVRHDEHYHVDFSVPCKDILNNR